MTTPYPQLSLYLNGQFVHGGGRVEQDVFNPATDEVIGRLPHASRDDLDLALTSAQKAFESWRKTSPMERSKVLRKVAAKVAARTGEPVVVDEDAVADLLRGDDKTLAVAESGSGGLLASVFTDLPPWMVARGNPAVPVKPRRFDEKNNESR